MTLSDAASPARAPRPTAHATLPGASFRLARLAAAALLTAACGVAHAAPDSVSDAVSRFLAERGLSVEAPAAEADAAPPPAASMLDRMRSTASELVLSAIDFLGVPYRRGGTSQDEGFDCSGFTRFVFQRTIGLVLPRRSDEQAASAQLADVARDELAPGDLVFFNTLRRAFSHVGIYVGDGKFIHAPRSGSSVRIEDMRGSYWARRFDGARRALSAGRQQAS